MFRPQWLATSMESLDGAKQAVSFFHMFHVFILVIFHTKASNSILLTSTLCIWQRKPLKAPQLVSYPFWRSAPSLP